jgi:splicing suppressor protein 51
MARKLNDQEYRNLRVHTLNTSENMLKRPLQLFEREIFLFPRLCAEPKCREWNGNFLTDCKKCHQTTYCKTSPDHLPTSHEKWCKSNLIYQKLVSRQKILGRIDPILPAKILTKAISLPENIDETINLMYTNTTGSYVKIFFGECFIIFLFQPFKTIVYTPVCHRWPPSL